MLYTIPDYYSSFNCIAGECPDTCCAGWQIAADEASMKKYSRIRGKAGRRLRRRIDRRRGIFKQTEGKRCAFLNNSNLCDMYTEFGKRSLCRTCRLYPRHVEEFEGVREITLSLSCPAVADMLMERMEPVKFLNYYKDREEEYEDFDVFLYSLLADAREVLYKIVQNRGIPILIREKLAAVSRLLIEEMLAARWVKNERTLYKEDITETVYRYSREIEHSDRNLAAMERFMDRLPARLPANLTSFVSG